MKQKLVSSGLVIADFIHRHPKRISAVIAAFLLGGGGGAFAVASLAPTAPVTPVRLLTESVDTHALSEQVEQLGAFTFTLYRSEQIRAADSPESMLKRLGVADPAAAAFLRRNELAWQSLFGRSTTGRTVTAEANDQNGLQLLRTQWVDDDSDTQFKRLVVEKSGDDFTARVETAPLEVTQRLASGLIRNTFFASTDAASVPENVARQFIDIFESRVDFRRGLRKGDRFSVVFESLEADGQVLGAGRILSAEVVNRGKPHHALWFKGDDAKVGGYYDFNGQSLQSAYLMAPLQYTRITSDFGVRNHPILGGQRQHSGVDYGAPTGTPVRTVGDGVVSFAGVQRGYGNVIYVKHRNGKDSTVYGHLSKIDVSAGDSVAQGEKIGEVGSTGIATGPHLHFEFRINDEPMDPTEVLAEKRGAAPIAANNRSVFSKYAADMRQQLKTALSITNRTIE